MIPIVTVLVVTALGLASTHAAYRNGYADGARRSNLIMLLPGIIKMMQDDNLTTQQVDNLEYIVNCIRDGKIV